MGHGKRVALSCPGHMMPPLSPALSMDRTGLPNLTDRLMVARNRPLRNALKRMNAVGMFEKGEPVSPTELTHGAQGTIYQIHALFQNTSHAVKISHENGGGADANTLSEEKKWMKAVACAPHVEEVGSVEGEEEEKEEFIVMEYIDGLTMAEALPSIRQYRLAAKNRFAHCLARGLAGLQEKKIIHWDANPKNVMIRRRNGEVKLIDFGLATGDQETQSPEAIQLRGRWNYLTPEQVINRKAHPLHDEFTVGCDLFELFSEEKLQELLFPEATTRAGALGIKEDGMQEKIDRLIGARVPDDRWKGMLWDLLRVHPGDRIDFTELSTRLAQMEQEDMPPLPPKSALAALPKKEEGEMTEIRDYPLYTA